MRRHLARVSLPPILESVIHITRDSDRGVLIKCMVGKVTFGIGYLRIGSQGAPATGSVMLDIEFIRSVFVVVDQAVGRGVEGG